MLWIRKRWDVDAISVGSLIVFLHLFFFCMCKNILSSLNVVLSIFYSSRYTQHTLNIFFSTQCIPFQFSDYEGSMPARYLRHGSQPELMAVREVTEHLPFKILFWHVLEPSILPLIPYIFVFQSFHEGFYLFCWLIQSLRPSDQIPTLILYLSMTYIYYDIDILSIYNPRIIWSNRI